MNNVLPCVCWGIVFALIVKLGFWVFESNAKIIELLGFVLLFCLESTIHHLVLRLIEGGKGACIKNIAGPKICCIQDDLQRVCPIFLNLSLLLMFKMSSIHYVKSWFVCLFFFCCYLKNYFNPKA